MFLFFFTLTWESSKRWCALGCPSFLLSHLFCSPTWDCSQSWCSLGKPTCGGSRSWCTPGHSSLSFFWLFLFLFSFCWYTHVGSGKSWCALGCPSFLLKPKWGGSRSWFTPGHPSFFVCSCCCSYTYVGQWQKLVCPWLSIFSFKPSGVVAGVGVPMATHLLFLLLLFIHLLGTVAKAGVPLTVHRFF